MNASLNFQEPHEAVEELDYHALNAKVNLLDENGRLQLGEDKKAVRAYFLEHVNKNMVFFHDLEEKLNYLVREQYYEKELLEKYDADFIKKLFKRAYSYRFRFPTYLGALKFYSQYALKTFDGKEYLERFEDRVVMNALLLANGVEEEAENLVDEIITNRYQPATPTFLNAGKKQRGEMVSCFLLRFEDNMESIQRNIGSALQLSKRGGGVAFNLTNLRELGAPIKNIENQASGVVPVMKILEDSFSYANQLGARQGAGAVYLNAHHPDIMQFLDTKRENADEKIRIKTLSLGVVIPDITFQLAKKGEDMYLFSPYDVQKVYGKPMSDISITEEYYSMVDNAKIRKKKVSARAFFQTIAEIQFESGYPYILFEDTANMANPIDGRINMSNLCSEILQVNEPSTFTEDGNFDVIGKDISCNLGSLNVAQAFDSPDFEKTISTAIRALTNVSILSNIKSSPSVHEGNRRSHAIGLGQMNLHGFFVRERMQYGSEESLDFTNIYFYSVLYYALKASNAIAREKGETFDGFERSKYATGEFFEKFINDPQTPRTEKVRQLLTKTTMVVPTAEDWAKLAEDVKQYGLFNQNLQAIPPTGSISYINYSTSSIHPVSSAIEARKEGKIGRVYYPQPYLEEDSLPYYKDAYEIGYEAIIDVYAEATKYIDQGLSLTLFFKDTATTRDLNKAYIYAWRKGIKTLYYSRIRNTAVDGTEVETAASYCVSCSL